jgi:intraflagellar transport protein 46
MNDDVSGEFSEDEFEVSAQQDVPKAGGKKEVKYSNREYDEGFEVSQDFSVADSFDGRNDAKGTFPTNKKETKLENDKYDEAVELSQSNVESFNVAASKMPTMYDQGQAQAKGGASQASSAVSGGSNAVKDRHHDEEVDFSNSEESVDTRHGDDRGARPQPAASTQAATSMPKQSAPGPIAQKSSPQHAQPIPANNRKAKAQVDESSSEEDPDGNAQSGSYDHIDGAYNPKDYANLQVPLEVKELFQYIERYKPQEVELNTQLRCFIPEYIPAIGEMDSFIKIPRADGREDELGLKVIDEPAAYQSDPVILELQLRAGIKRSQLGEVSVRSVDNAAKNPQAIQGWVDSIKETHRIKPPPQVHYRKNMPDIENLMDQWPDEFEAFLEAAQASVPPGTRGGPAAAVLPSPDLDLSLAEYVKVLCSLLDIPVYDNPIESLHVMFTLFQDFKNNPHFQARLAEEDPTGARIQNNYGSADVMELGDSSPPEYYK